MAQPTNLALQQVLLQAFNVRVYDETQTDVQQTPVYDTVTIAASGTLSTQTSQWFVNVGGSSSKNYSKTNMGTPKRLAAPETFSVQSIRLKFSELITLADFVAIQNGFAFEFWIGQKVYQRCPIWMLAAGGGIVGTGTSTTVAATTITAWTNGVPASNATLTLNLPLVLGNQVDFYAQLAGDTQTLSAGGTGAIMQCVLEGYYSRGIQ